MKKIFSLLILLLLASAVTAPLHAGQKEKGKLSYNGFSGGMMLHTGYLYGGRTTVFDGAGLRVSDQKMRGMPTGIGGAVKFHFGKWLRIGTEGYVSTLKYGDHGSNIRVGWGGILVDGIWKTGGRISPFAGFTVGGGSASNLTLATEAPDDFIAEENASFRKYPFACIVPYVGLEYDATSRVRIVLKADYMINVSNSQPDFPSGPRIYIGFLFYRGH